MKKSHIFLMAGVIVAGCNSDPTNVGTTPLDASTTDTSSADVFVATDTGRSDSGRPDGSTQDVVTQVDGAAPDAGEADAGEPDASAPDAGEPDASAPDASVPDARVPDASVPDASVPDASVPDASVPDASVPDATAMDASEADASAPDAGMPIDAGTHDGGGDGGTAGDGAACVPATETCNGRDDNCNGAIDENGCGTHLLITEVAGQPDEAEMIEIYNPTSAPIDLSNYYVSDVNTYACVVTRNCLNSSGMVATPTVTSSDFVARFPAGAMIAPGQYRTVAIHDPADFNSIYHQCPDFYLPRSSAMTGSCSSATVMRAARDTAGNVGSTAGLTNGGEPAILFQWVDGADLVIDVDIVVFGSPSSTNVGADKTGQRVMTAGGTAMYHPDTAVMSQSRAVLAMNGATMERCDYSEGTETHTGGNGVGGHDETSENLAVTFRPRAPAASGDAGLTSINGSPGAPSVCH